MTGVMWNLWHGCHKLSEGCKNCYVYMGDAKYDRDSSIVEKTQKFDLPIAKDRKGNYKVKAGSLVWTCFTSDFMLSDCDDWRIDAWEMIKTRYDCHFLFITKRIDRFNINLPSDWGDGYDNVTVCCTCENQRQADYRLPIFNSLPIKHKVIINEPLLESIQLSKYLDDSIEQVVVGGESGNFARICNYDWVMEIRRQCIENNISFHFKQTGAKFKKDEILYSIKRPLQHSQAKKADINFLGKHKSYL